MRRTDSGAAMTEAVARFQAEIRNLAFAIAREALSQGLDTRPRPAEVEPAPSPRRVAAPQEERQPKPKPAQQPKSRRARQSRPQLELGLASEQPSAPDVARPSEPATTAAPAPEPAAPAGPSDAAATPAAAPEPAPAAPAGNRKRVPWTRETIVNELATWMLNGTALDAQFMTRHGPKGLVPAIRRVFGRFEAALNVAALHLSKLYPDGPPTNRPSPVRVPKLAQPTPNPHEPG